MSSSLPKCYFNYDTLIAKVGNSFKGYEELKCLQVPPFKAKTYERESLGGGWYGSKEWIERIYDQYFVIMKDDKPFGVLYHPYSEKHNIKSDIHPINSKHPFPQITEFIKTL